MFWDYHFGVVRENDSVRAFLECILKLLYSILAGIDAISISSTHQGNYLGRL
jgi:hypothetical protein